MSDNTALTQLSKSMALKSLKDLVRVRTAEKTVLLLDCSGSMSSPMRNGKLRITGLREVVRDVQQQRPTEMIAFGPLVQTNPGEWTAVRFVSDVPEPGGGTPLHDALKFAAVHGAGRCVVISDGWPNDRTQALEAAKQFGGQVDIVFVGDPNDPGSFFLDELAKTTGGRRFEGDLSEIKELAGTVVGLLNGEVLEEVKEGIELGDGEDLDDDDDSDDEEEIEEDDDDDE